MDWNFFNATYVALNLEDSIKEHLLDHVNLPSYTSERKEKECQKGSLTSGNLLDLYDDDGNPLYDSTNSEYSDSE